MKKIICLLVASGLTLASSVYAADTASSQSDVEVTISVTAANANGGGDFTYKASPNVQLKSYSSATAYTLGSYNNKTDTNNGMEYGTTNSSTGYAQQILESTPLDKLGTTAGDLTDSSWSWMGGS